MRHTQQQLPFTDLPLKYEWGLPYGSGFLQVIPEWPDGVRTVRMLLPCSMEATEKLFDFPVSICHGGYCREADAYIYYITKNDWFYWRFTFGATRFVLITDRLVFKIPRLSSWKSFLQGLLANMQEREFARTGWEELCPVFFADPFGLLVVMPKCMPLRRDFWVNEFDYSAFCNREDYVIPVEQKHDSFGRYKGKIVAVDYGS